MNARCLTVAGFFAKRPLRGRSLRCILGTNVRGASKYGRTSKDCGRRRRRARPCLDVQESPTGSESATSGVASGVNAGVYEGCAKINAKAVLASWDNTIDSIRRSDATDFSGPQIFVHVSTERWRDAGHEGRLSIAIAAYCDAADTHGKGVAIIKGSLDEKLGGVVDGNYTSP